MQSQVVPCTHQLTHTHHCFELPCIPCIPCIQYKRPSERRLAVGGCVCLSGTQVLCTSMRIPHGVLVEAYCGSWALRKSIRLDMEDGECCRISISSNLKGCQHCYHTIVRPCQQELHRGLKLPRIILRSWSLPTTDKILERHLCGVRNRPSSPEKASGKRHMGGGGYQDWRRQSSAEHGI